MALSDALPLLINMSLALAMTGVIWFVQIIHYPLFAAVAPRDLSEFVLKHISRTRYLVGPLIVAELLAAVWLALEGGVWTWFALGLVVLLWAITFSVQVPLHRRLSQQYDATLIRRLVTTNWLRTSLWTIRSGLLLILVCSRLDAI